MGTSYTMRKRYFQVGLVAVIFGLLLTACPDPPPLPVSVQRGVFLDSAVDNLRFNSTTQSGFTDANGAFRYLEGEVVSFFIGDILLGSATGKAVLTPIDFVSGAVDETHPQVTNITRFLLTLDLDNNPDNGIQIRTSILNLASGRAINFAVSISVFEASGNVLRIVNDLTSLLPGGSRNLISASSAQAHLRATLGKAPLATHATLTVTVNGVGSETITSSPTGINNCSATCSASFPSGTLVTLSHANPGSTFSAWSGDCTGTGTCTFRMNANKLVTATFAFSGGGGAGDPGDTIATATPLPLPSPPISGNIDPLGDVDFFRFSASAGSRVTIDIDAAVTGSPLDSFLRLFNSSGVEIASNDDEPSSVDSFIDHPLSTTGSYFIAVSGSSDRSTGPYTLKIMLDVAQAEPTLTVTKGGTGSGTVNSSPAGINNCSAICTASFPSGTPVTLTALPATGSNFTGWSDPACTGIGTCTLIITENKSVIATFGTTTAPPPPDPSGVFGSLSITGAGTAVVGTRFNSDFLTRNLSQIPSIGLIGLLEWFNHGGNLLEPNQEFLQVAILRESATDIQFTSKTTSGSGFSPVIQIVTYSLNCNAISSPDDTIECNKVSVDTTAKTITFNNAQLTLSRVISGVISNSGPIIFNGELTWQ